MNYKIIRVIHSSPIWLPQTQTWMFTQIKYLPDDIEVHIVCDRKQNIDQFNLPNIWCLQDTSIFRYYWEKGLRKLLLPQSREFLRSIAINTKAQIIHSHFGSNGWFDLKSAKLAETKHVVTFYGYDVNGLLNSDHRWFSRYQELFSAADAFLFEGPFMAKQIENLGCAPEKIHVHHLGIPVETIPYHPRNFKKGDTLKVLIAATFNEKKGIPYALEALTRLQKVTPLEITIIGDAVSTADSKKEKIRILEIIEKSGLQKNTKLLGFQQYSVLMSEAYKNHVFLSPSVMASNGDTEGGAPVSIIEMMASGMPVVSTRHCDIPEVVHYGKDDWLVEEKDVDGLYEKLCWLLENVDSWRSMLDYGRQHVEMEFNAATQGKRLGKIYSDVLKK